MDRSTGTGRYSSDSNAAFDQSLQARGAHMAIRDAEAVDALAAAAGFRLHRRHRDAGQQPLPGVAPHARLSRACTEPAESGTKADEVDRHADRPAPAAIPPGYTHCCAPLHDGEAATTAAQLMRSRYSAYVLKREDYLLASWHARRDPPASLRLAAQQPPPTWLGLEIRHHEAIDSDHARVEFVARYRLGGGRAQRQHEISRFVREDGRWYYLDGELKS